MGGALFGKAICGLVRYCAVLCGWAMFGKVMYGLGGEKKYE